MVTGRERAIASADRGARADPDRANNQGSTTSGSEGGHGSGRGGAPRRTVAVLRKIEVGGAGRANDDGCSTSGSELRYPNGSGPAYEPWTATRRSRNTVQPVARRQERERGTISVRAARVTRRAVASADRGARRVPSPIHERRAGRESGPRPAWDRWRRAEHEVPGEDAGRGPPWHNPQARTTPALAATPMRAWLSQTLAGAA